MKAAIRTFCNEGHDILLANDMHIALKERQVKALKEHILKHQILLNRNILT